MRTPQALPDGCDSLPADAIRPRRSHTFEGHGWIEQAVFGDPLTDQPWTEESGPRTEADERLRRFMHQAVRDVAAEGGEAE